MGYMSTRTKTCIQSNTLDLDEATRKLKDHVRQEAQMFLEQPVLLAQSLKETEGEPRREIRIAKAVAHLLRHVPLKIREGEILLGWHPNSKTNNASQDLIEEARSVLHKQLWRGFVSEGHMVPDYPTILKKGLAELIHDIRQYRSLLDPIDSSTPSKETFYESCEIALSGLQELIKRYAREAERLIPEAKDPLAQKELALCASACDWITEHPPRDFREAMQLTWFVFLAVALEAGESHHCYGPGRMDQYLFPFYARDRGSGTLPDEILERLLDQFFIKCNEFHGDVMSAVILVVGGRTPQGTDATNELSYKILEASDRVRMYFPGVDVSWHQDMDPSFTRAAVQMLRNQGGQPAFFNSDLIIKGLMNKGVPFEHAVDHVPSTCTETSIMGRCNPHVAWPYINVAMCLEYALFGGRHPFQSDTMGFFRDVGVDDSRFNESLRQEPSRHIGIEPETFEALRDKFHDLMNLAAKGAMAHCQAQLQLQMENRPFPLLSCFVRNCMERGKNISHGGALYNFVQPEAVGISNVVDGLVAVKVLTEKTHRFTLDSFRQAILDDFQGHEKLRKAILRDCPKHGNDVDWVNDLFAKIAGAWCNAFHGSTHRLDGPFLPGFLGWTVWIHFGEQTPASLDGRQARAPLAHSIVNCTGTEVKGFPDVILSTARFDQSRALGGVVFNVRFSSQVLDTEKGVEGLQGLIEGAFDLGCYQIQVNLTSSEILRKAQNHPEDYRDLLVRIGGYLVPFTLLPRHAQDDVIARTELEM